MADNQNLNPQQSQNNPGQPAQTAVSSGIVPAQSANQVNNKQPTTALSQELDLNYEIQALKEKVENSKVPQNLKDKLNGMILRLVKMSHSGNYSQEFEPVSEYINWVVQIPFGVFTEDNIDINHARDELTKNHYGLNEVKNRIMEYLAILKLHQVEMNMSDSDAELRGSSFNAPILCFVGIQGVGKTSMAKSISSALGRKFYRIALGALGSVTEIRGVPKSSVSAEPGQIVKTLIRTESMNPLILLDEIDKVSSDTGLRSDVMAALLEILDPEQNSGFVDKYLDYPLNLSKCIFICTANNLGGISAALLDRLEIVRFGSYTDSEKEIIAKNYLLPKVRKATGLQEAQLSFADDVWPMVVRPLGFDAGVRQLERNLTQLARKVALQIVQGQVQGVQVNQQNFRTYIPEDFGVYS